MRVYCTCFSAVGWGGMLQRKILDIKKTAELMEENFLGADDESERYLREEFSDMMIRIIMEGPDRHFWNDPVQRVHVLAIALNILRFDYKDPEQESNIADFIAKHKLGTIDFLQELSELGLDFNHTNKLNIIHALEGANNDVDIFLGYLTELYDAGLYNMEQKASTDSLLQYIKWCNDKYHRDIADSVKLHVLEMYCANGNPNFQLFGRVIKRLFKHDDMETTKAILAKVCTKNTRDFFGDMEGTFEDMKAQIQFNDKDAEYVRKLIHKNTTLSKTGKVADSRKEDKRKKKDLLYDKLHMFRPSAQQKLQNDANSDSDTGSSNSNKTEDSFIDQDSGSESPSDDGSYEDKSSSEEGEEETNIKKRKLRKE